MYHLILPISSLSPGLCPAGKWKKGSTLLLATHGPKCRALEQLNLECSLNMKYRRCTCFPHAQIWMVGFFQFSWSMQREYWQGLLSSQFTYKRQENKKDGWDEVNHESTSFNTQCFGPQVPLLKLILKEGRLERAWLKAGWREDSAEIIPPLLLILSLITLVALF